MRLHHITMHVFKAGFKEIKRKRIARIKLHCESNSGFKNEITEDYFRKEEEMARL